MGLPVLFTGYDSQQEKLHGVHAIKLCTNNSSLVALQVYRFDSRQPSTPSETWLTMFAKCWHHLDWIAKLVHVSCGLFTL